MSTLKVTNVQHGDASVVGIILKADGTVEIPSLDVALEALSDLNVDDPQAGQLLGYDGDDWVNLDATAVVDPLADARIAAASIDDLADVEAPAPTDGQALVYDDYADAWVAGEVASDLDGLTDVTITAPTTGQALVYDDEIPGWKNDTFPAVQLRTADVVVEVGPGGDVDTINEALEELSTIRKQYAPAEPLPITGLIRLRPDFAMTEQVLVDGHDFSWVTIVSDAGTDPVAVQTFSAGTLIPGFARPEVSQVTVSTLTSGADLDDHFVIADDADGTTYYFWYQVLRFAETTIQGRVRVVSDTPGPSDLKVVTAAGTSPGDPLDATLVGDDIEVTLGTRPADTQATGLLFSADGAVVQVDADAAGPFDGAAGNLDTEFVDTGAGGLDAAVLNGTLTIDFGGNATRSAALVAAAIGTISGLTATVNTAGDFTVADDVGPQSPLAGGFDAGSVDPGQNTSALVATAIDAVSGVTASAVAAGSITVEDEFPLAGGQGESTDPSLPAVTTFNVTNDGSGAYIINGQSNPALTLERGVTYTFNINAVGHPFWITDAPGAYDPGNVFNDGVTNNGTDDGVITFAVPAGAPDDLYYVCQFHSAMSGSLNIVDGPESVEVTIDTSFDGEQAAGELRDAVDAQATLTVDPYVVGRLVRWENDADGEADDTLVVGGNLAVVTVQQGEDDGFQTLVTAPGHTFDDGDLVTIRDHVGTIQELDYNGRWTVANSDIYAGTFELDFVADPRSLFSADRAGVPDTAEAVLPANVPVSRAALTQVWEFFYFPAFGVARGTLPTIGCVFEMDETGPNPYISYKDGLNATDQGRINILPFSGFVNAGGANIYATRSSIINANDAVADGAKGNGIWAYSTSIINARRASAANCGSNGAAEDVGGGFDATGLPVGSAVLAERGSLINAEGVDATGSTGTAFLAQYGGQINVGADPGLAQGFGTSSLGQEFEARGGIVFGVNGDSQGWIAPPVVAMERIVVDDDTTLELADRGMVVAMDSDDPHTVTVPLNATVAFPVGTIVNVYRAGEGEVDIVGEVGVTIRNGGEISEQFGEVSLRKRAANEWVLVGEVDEP